jgi:hypothetical protein
VPPFHVHSSRSHGETDVRLLRVPATLAEQLPPEPSVFVASTLMREAYLAMINDHEPADSPRTRLLLEVVTAELARAPQKSLRLPEPNDTRLKAVTNLLHADPADPATLAELGRRTGSSERTLSRCPRCAWQRPGNASARSSPRYTARLSRPAPGRDADAT